MSLPDGEMLCSKCAAAVKCLICKRKLRLVRFAMNADVCEACYKKSVGRRQTGGGASFKSAMESLFNKHTLPPSSVSMVDINEYIIERGLDIQLILIDALIHNR